MWNEQIDALPTPRGWRISLRRAERGTRCSPSVVSGTTCALNATYDKFVGISPSKSNTQRRFQ